MFYLHRSERTDALALALAAVTTTSLNDPFTSEVIAVPSKGVERWLAQRLSHVLGAEDGDGVCANVVFPSHVRLLDDATAAADPSYRESVDGWAPERAVWPLMDVINNCTNEDWCRSLAVHLGLVDGSGDKGRRYAVASKLAVQFAAYGRSRPAMLRAWRDGRDEQGDGTELPGDVTWQAELWRRLRDAIGVPSPAELIDEACEKLRADPTDVDLPARFSVFGATRISVSRVSVLAALAVHRDVHLWLHHASPAVWDAVAASEVAPGRRRLDTSASLVRHPLLASMTRDVRELQLLLRSAAPDLVDTHHVTAERLKTLLGVLQDDLANDRIPTERATIAAGDRTIQVHACHGSARQIEVVREAVLGLLNADPTLEPRDVLIMCPDVESFAPLVAASFGMAEEVDGHPAAKLRVRLADRALRQTNPLLSLLSLLLELGASRVTATQLLDLAGTAPVRRRFGFDDDDIERLRDWTAESGTRWGLDAEHRAPYGLGTLQHGTWRFGMDRVLVGAVMEEDVDWVGGALPLDDVDSGDIDLAGRMAELVDRVDVAVRAMAENHVVADWVALLEEAVLSLGEPALHEDWQVAQLRQELTDVADAAEGATVVIALADITALLQARLRGRPTRASFRTGTLTVCSLVPMRSVPHRVVCIVGLDDGAFPRQGIADGDDILARDPRTGERDVRSEDRQLFLDAVCAAQEHLVLAYTGADPRSGAEVPPAVPLGEFLDAIDLTFTAPDGGRAHEHLVVHHPLQPFAARNFLPDELGSDGPFSFDSLALDGAKAAAKPRVAVPALVTQRLAPPAADDTIALDRLIYFLQHPARGFLRQRLAVTMSASEEDPSDAMPVHLDGLQAWDVGARVLRRILAGTPRETAATLEHLRGVLPPGPLGTEIMRDIGTKVDALLAACASELFVAAEVVDVAVLLPYGRRLVGTVPGVRGETVLSVVYSTLAPKHRLASWVNHLALQAIRPDLDLTSVAVGRGGRDRVRRCVISKVDPQQAREYLAEIVALRDAGLREPLPMALATSAAYADRRVHGDEVAEVIAAADKKWTDDKFRPERDEAEHVLAWGSFAPLAKLLEALPEPDEQSSQPDEPSRFGALACRLWAPLIAHENDITR